MEEYFQQLSLEMEDDFSLEDDCPTIEHQALKELYRERSGSRFDFGNAPRDRTINVFAGHRRFAFKVLTVHAKGIIALDEQSNMSLVRGTLFYDPAQPPFDHIGRALITKLFDSRNFPSQVHLSRHHSIPVLAAKGQIVEGGHLVLSPAYTKKQMADAIKREQIDPEVMIEIDNVKIQHRVQPVFWREGAQVAPYEITKIL